MDLTYEVPFGNPVRRETPMSMPSNHKAEQIWSLRVEAEESRRLAASFADRLSVIDLQCYASELEAEAEKLQLEQNQQEDLRTIICAGHA